MIQAFVSGQLSEADHALMAHHIATCQECAAGVAAERIVRVEMAKLSARADMPVPVPQAAFVEPPAAGSPPMLPSEPVVPAQPTAADSAPVSAGADVLSGTVIQSGDLSVPPVPELQLDFILDRTSEGAGMLLPREPVREVSLDHLPPAPVHSVRRPQRENEDREASAEVESARVAYADDIEIAAATMAGIADSVAHGAAALATSGPPEILTADVEEPMPVAVAREIVEPEPMPVAAATETVEPEPMPTEAATETTEPEPIPVEAATPMEEAEPPAIEEIAIIERPEPLVVEEAPVVEISEPAPTEDVAVIEEQESTVVEEQGTSEAQPADERGAVAEDSPAVQPRMAMVVAPAASATVPGSGVLWRWSAAAALLVVTIVAAYAATQVRSSAVATAATARDRLEGVSDSAAEWQTPPSVLTPILDSAVYSRVLDVALVADSLADSRDAGGSYDPFAGDTIGGTAVSPPATASVRPAPRARRVRRPERLPQIVSDPPDTSATQARQPPGEILPEVVTGNAPARTTARGSAVVISGAPDIPRLLRTTTHRPRPDVAYVLREYDASGAEPAPRGGVNEYRWSDATGSRLYVLSGPVDVTELRAYARRLQSQGR